MADHDPEDVIAALIKMSHDGEFDTEGYRDLEKVTIDTTGKSRLFIALGRNK
ncbi:hypothetical protein KKH82_09075 [Patescibacteria group bacterium]|nr:hypothetical protein [Patescibacteria group bacterium]